MISKLKLVLFGGFFSYVMIALTWMFSKIIEWYFDGAYFAMGYFIFLVIIIIYMFIKIVYDFIKDLNFKKL